MPSGNQQRVWVLKKDIKRKLSCANTPPPLPIIFPSVSCSSSLHWLVAVLNIYHCNRCHQSASGMCAVNKRRRRREEWTRGTAADAQYQLFTIPKTWRTETENANIRTHVYQLQKQIINGQMDTLCIFPYFKCGDIKKIHMYFFCKTILWPDHCLREGHFF